MRTLCIAGKNDIAVNVLEYYLQQYTGLQDVDIIYVFNRTETGKNGWQKSFKWHCEKYGVKTARLEEVYNIKDMVFLSLEFDRLVRPDLFKSKELYNIHFSYLPKYKGMFTSVHPILNDEQSTGVTLHKIRAGIDTGEIIAQKEIPIDYADTALDVYRKLIQHGSQLAIENLDNLLRGKVSAVPQETRHSTYYSSKSIDFSNVLIDLNCTAHQIHNQVRAFSFRPYQLLQYRGTSLIDVGITDHVSENKPGTLLEETRLWFKLATVDYDILIYKDVLKELIAYIQEKKNEEAKLLCASSKIINAQEEHGWTPIMVAAYNNNVEMFEFLLAHGADIFLTNDNGTNLIMYAKDGYKMYGDEALFQRCLELGLDPAMVDYYGKNLFDYCREERISHIGMFQIK